MRNDNVLHTITTDDEGTFSVGGVEAGLYNFVVLLTTSNGNKEVVLAQQVACTIDENIKLVVENENVSTRVNITSGNMNFVVDDMMNAFTANEIKNNDSVDLLIEIKDVNEGKINNISNKAGSDSKDVANYFIAQGVKQTITSEGNVSSDTLTELSGLVKITIMLNDALLNKSNYVIYREANGVVEQIGGTANANGEYVRLSADGRSLEVYMCKLGKFAVGYDTERMTSSSWIAIVAVAAVLMGGIVALWVFLKKRNKKMGR